MGKIRCECDDLLWARFAGARRVESATYRFRTLKRSQGTFGVIQRVRECDFALFRSTRTSTR
jgi:hypothetical protein